jgi:hypothetical protein
LGLAKKIKLLQNEGIKIKGDKIANFKSYLYHPVPDTAHTMQVGAGLCPS